MDAAQLSDRLKALLSIRAVLDRAGVNQSTYYTAAHRGSAVSPENRAKIRQALLDTAADLKKIAGELK